MNFATDLFKRVLEVSPTATAIFERFPSQSPNAYVNAAFEQLTGFSASDFSQAGLAFLNGEETDARSIARLQAAMVEGSELRLAILSYRKDGRAFWNLMHIMPLRDEGGASTHYMGMLADITEERRYVERLEHRAHHDPLTGLPNRHLLYDRLDLQLALARQEGRSLALVFVDVNHFKQINDRFGHDVGDELLKLVAARLAHCVRVGDTVARYGGDEFVLLIREDALNLGFPDIEDRISNAMKRPVIAGGYQIDFSCSVGVSVYPADGCDRTTLLRRADIDMYCRKSAGTSAPNWVFRRDAIRSPDGRPLSGFRAPPNSMTAPAKRLRDHTEYIRPVTRAPSEGTVQHSSLASRMLPRRGQPAIDPAVSTVDDKAHLGALRTGGRPEADVP